MSHQQLYFEDIKTKASSTHTLPTCAPPTCSPTQHTTLQPVPGFWHSPRFDWIRCIGLIPSPRDDAPPAAHDFFVEWFLLPSMHFS
jgi:hypothetical protein